MSTEFYSGPLWKERAAAANARIADIDNVLLLRPAAAGRGLTPLPVVDAAEESGTPAGVAVLQIFGVKAGRVEAAVREAESLFSAYRDAGAHEAGVLVSLDAPNNYPRLPVRTDGPYLVWVGVAKDDAMLQDRLLPLTKRAASAPGISALLRGAPETVILDPTRRSRLRWRSEWN